MHNQDAIPFSLYHRGVPVPMSSISNNNVILPLGEIFLVHVSNKGLISFSAEITCDTSTTTLAMHSEVNAHAPQLTKKKFSGLLLLLLLLLVCNFTDDMLLLLLLLQLLCVCHNLDGRMDGKQFIQTCISTSHITKITIMVR